MATWIVHLRLAENLLKLLPDLDAEKFALGSVAPDSGKPDEKWEHFTPPTEVTHFSDPKDERRMCSDLDFYRSYLHPLRDKPDSKYFSFRLGFFFHLVTDNLWTVKIGQPTQQCFAEKFAADRDFIWEVKGDWYGLDFRYVRDHPDCLFWRVFLNAQPELGGLDFIVPDSIRWSVAHIQEYYQRTDDEIQAMYKRPYIYLSQAEMDRFVDESSQQLFRIYQQLWVNGMTADGVASVLELEI